MFNEFSRFLADCEWGDKIIPPKPRHPNISQVTDKQSGTLIAYAFFMPYFITDSITGERRTETPEEKFMRMMDEQRVIDKAWSARNTILPDSPKPDPFSVRYGYIAGRCNAYRRVNGRKHPEGLLCRQWPQRGRSRCRRHDPWWKRRLRKLFT